MTSRAVLAFCLAAALCASARSRAAEPASGEPPAPAAPALAQEEEARTSPEPPVAPPRPEPARSWLARGGGAPVLEQPAGSGSSTPFTVGAVLIVAALAAAALVMRQRRQRHSPLGPSDSRLTVLSSSRVGPKAYAVTAHINGRPLLLGVTDHNVTLLGWLDARDPHGAGESLLGTSADDELPEDYPGSALRAAGRAAPLASTQDLKRFQEVLRGVEQARPGGPLRPSHEPSGDDAASLLAAQTVDVVGAARSAGGHDGSQTPVSLRRKRQPREAPPAPESRAAGKSAGAKTNVEGQVAGLLRSLRNG